MNEQLDFFPTYLLGVILGEVTMEFHFDFGPGVINKSMFLKIIPPASTGIKKWKIPYIIHVDSWKL